ncbi:MULTISPECIES: hypothetical protein [unclassified Pseudomonas]|uniref:hypothetical protein n=1 Tax=unclassified Pseudomonas TaxID=196821 RepID=UPI0030DC9CC3
MAEKAKSQTSITTQALKLVDWNHRLTPHDQRMLQPGSVVAKNRNLSAIACGCAFQHDIGLIHRSRHSLNELVRLLAIQRRPGQVAATE